MRTTSPTRPTSIFVFLVSDLSISLRAWMKCAILAREAHGLAAGLVDEGDDLLVEPAQHHLDHVDPSSVTRMPWMNSLCLPSFCSSSPICGPPPCTTTGFMPISFSSTTSSAKSSCSAGSVIALPPYLTTIVLS